ncbi:thermonuclease family protein [Sphingomonas sp.]|uniref:thermonuclease family protein n=1 Tax=Sphingomonas sp. TaxID=28214 RepID=UPI00307D58ED
MRRLIALALLAMMACFPFAAREATSFNATARALDGDTVAADFRLLGVDAFERGQLCEKHGSCWRCGKAAQDLAARMLRQGDAEIRLSTQQSYGRPVATIMINGQDLGEMMIRAGLAVPQPQLLKSDPLRVQRYARTFSNARQSKAGAFAGRWLEPALWRRGSRLACER